MHSEVEGEYTIKLLTTMPHLLPTLINFRYSRGCPLTRRGTIPLLAT